MPHRARLLGAAIASSTIGLATLAAAAPAHAAFPGHNGKLVYLNIHEGPGGGGRNEIFTSRRNGTHPVQLTHKRQNDQPRWAPHGHRILYTHKSAKGPHQIWVMGAHGHKKTHLPGQGRTNNSEAAWAPDGHRIVFTQFSLPFNPFTVDLAVYSLDTHVLTPLHVGHGFDRIPSAPAWSPDGEHIAFAAVNKNAANPNGSAELYVVQPDGQGLSQITHSTHFAEGHPNWSPDGRRLVYERIGGKSPDIYCQQLDTINADGTDRRRLRVGCHNGWPTWSPNGRKILAYRAGPVEPGLWKMSPKGHHLRFITLGFNADWQPLP
jgi:Tol biopolymer transport system component